MAYCKTWQTTVLQRRLFAASGPYTTAGGVTLDAGATWTIRAYYLTNNDPGAVDCTGSIRFQIRRLGDIGGGWGDALVEDPNPVKVAESGTVGDPPPYVKTWTAPAEPGTYELRALLDYNGAGGPSTFSYPSNIVPFFVARVASSEVDASAGGAALVAAAGADSVDGKAGRSGSGAVVSRAVDGSASGASVSASAAPRGGSVGSVTVRGVAAPVGALAVNGRVGRAAVGVGLRGAAMDSATGRVTLEALRGGQ